nr:RNA polymerase sigma factor [Caloranaerobacter azorensis]
MVLFEGKREQNTDLDLFKKLFDKYYAKVYKTAFYILRNQQDAKDATQEAFIIAYDKFHTLRDQSEFGSWICTIVANKAKEIYKARKKETLIDDINKVIPFIKENTGVKLPEEIIQKKNLKSLLEDKLTN